jgi:hypothetical protein
MQGLSTMFVAAFGGAWVAVWIASRVWSRVLRDGRRRETQSEREQHGYDADREQSAARARAELSHEATALLGHIKYLAGGEGVRQLSNVFN